MSLKGCTCTRCGHDSPCLHWFSGHPDDPPRCPSCGGMPDEFACSQCGAQYYWAAWSWHKDKGRLCPACWSALARG